MADPQTYRPAPGSIPEAPGVYRFSDETGRVIYVGKAKSLRSRLNSYFADVAGLHPRTRRMVTTAAAVQWTVVHTEVEALQLEYNWIKEFDPRFNVRYRDDKTYPVLAVTLNEEYPQLRVYRGPRRKGVRYFGPYAHAWAIRETVKLLTRVFPARQCSGGVFKRHGQIGRPCMLGYIDKCAAPCVGRVSAEEHREIVLDFCDFLGGHTDQLIGRIEKQMQVAAADMDFEKAARLRDELGDETVLMADLCLDEFTSHGHCGVLADDGTVEAALTAGTLVRTWAARGTLHLLATDQAPSLLALLAAARSWDKGSWQREFATAAQMTALEAAVVDVLADGAVLTREELTAALVAGAVVAHEAMTALGLEEVEVCPWALREGIILGRLDQLQPGGGMLSVGGPLATGRPTLHEAR